MDGNPHLTIGYRLNDESPMQVLGGWSPSYELRGMQFGKLSISMVESKGLAFVNLARNEIGQDW